MQKIQINVSNDTISFAYKTTPSIQPNLNNTNVISDNEIVFSKKYIEENGKLVALFIKELCQEKNLYRANIETNELCLFLIDLFKKNAYITSICIQENSTLPFALYEKIIENKNINYIEANSIQEYMFELLDKNGIRGESRTEIFYPSHFMQDNNLTSFSKIFYKMNIRIDQLLTEEDKDDFLAFCTINKYLKTIHISKYNKNDLEYILDVLNENRIKNIKLLLYDNIKEYKTIEYLKKLNRKIKKRKYKIELVYSQEYLKNNLFTQIILNTLKVCGLITMMIVVSIITYVSISNYVSLNEVTKIQESVKETIIENKSNEDDNKTIISNEKKVKNKYLLSILSMNPDVVGWLKVNGTNVDYPVVQKDNNDYYLNHNLNNEEDKNGWIFMDYRNSKTNLDSNTIIFGHNMYYSSIMFGSLFNATKKTWYTNPDNLILTFDTIYESNQYQIFSIYKIPKTSDYLKTYFATDEEFIHFVDLIKNRSIYDFEVELNPGDKIITLSTCSDSNNRLVIHAKLIAST